MLEKTNHPTAQHCWLFSVPLALSNLRTDHQTLHSFVHSVSIYSVSTILQPNCKHKYSKNKIIIIKPEKEIKQNHNDFKK